jgi:hypothetical protein
MKKLSFLVAAVLLVSCNTIQTEKADAKSSEMKTENAERSIGFNTMLLDLKFHLGTEVAIKVVKDLDEKWSDFDYEGMKEFFVDTAEFYFPDGFVAKSPDEFIEKIKEDDEGADVSWTFDYAFSVDLDPTRGGEHVQAGFTGTSVEDGVEEKKSYHESYYVIDGKIVSWRQYTMDIDEE